MATAASTVAAIEAEDAAALARIGALVEQMDRRIEDAAPSPGRSDTRERILAVAMELFAQRGFEACTVRDLADAVGIKPPGIYSHFRSKEAIFSEAMLRALRGFLARMAAAGQARDAEARLGETIGRHVAYQLEHAQLARAHDLLLNSRATERFLPEEERRLLHDARRAYYELVRGRIAAVSGIESATALTTTTFAVTTLCDGVLNWYRPDGALTVGDVAERYWHLVRGMLRIG